MQFVQSERTWVCKWTISCRLPGFVSGCVQDEKDEPEYMKFVVQTLSRGMSCSGLNKKTTDTRTKLVTTISSNTLHPRESGTGGSAHACVSLSYIVYTYIHISVCVCGRGLRYNKHCVNNLATSTLKELTEVLVFVRSVMVAISTEHTLDKSHALFAEFEDAKMSFLSWDAYESRDTTAKGCRAAILLLASSVKNASKKHLLPEAVFRQSWPRR